MLPLTERRPTCLEKIPAMVPDWSTFMIFMQMRNPNLHGLTVPNSTGLDWSKSCIVSGRRRDALIGQ